MWPRRIALVLLVLLVSSMSGAGTITRGIKSGTGTTAFGDATTILASEMNTDFDTIVNVINGNIDNANIKAAAGIAYSKLTLTDSILNTDVNSSAAIDLSKLDDYSTNDAQQITTTDPGTSDALTNATTMQIELTQLRHQLQELMVGIPDTSAVAAAGGTATSVSWADGPIRGGNLIYNGGFDSIDDLSITADGDGWARVLTPTTLQKIALTEADGQGDGNAIQIIDTADALSGISQTVDGLKASTTYLVTGTVYDNVGTCSIRTTGADTNQLTLISDDSGSWQVLAGTFQTDSTPTNIVVKLLAVAASDDCYFENIGLYEISANPTASGGITSESDITTSVAAIGAGTAVPDISIDVTPPMPNCLIEVNAVIAFEETGGQTDGSIVMCNIDEEGTNKTSALNGVFLDVSTVTAFHSSVNLYYALPNATPGTDYTYTVECTDAIAGSAQAVFECDTYTCEMWVKMSCPTR